MRFNDMCGMISRLCFCLCRSNREERDENGNKRNYHHKSLTKNLYVVMPALYCNRRKMNITIYVVICLLVLSGGSAKGRKDKERWERGR